MAQRKPEEHDTIEQVLRLVEQLSPEGRDEVLAMLKQDELRRDIQVGIDQANKGEIFSEEEVLTRLKTHSAELRKVITAL